MIVDIVSDLHGAKPSLKGGDLLILAGDYTAKDAPLEYSGFLTWLMNLPYRKKVYIGGNHDNLFVDSFPEKHYAEETEAFEYLCDSGTEFEGLKIWGSPWTAWFHGINPHCKAWTLTGDDKLAKKWALIPEDTDILITHSPPFGILDEIMGTHNFQSVGSQSLLARVREIRPELHVFGHIHEGYGQYEAGDVHFVNASIMDVNYVPSNKPVRLEL